MNEEQFYRVVWGVAGVPALGWGVKVFADIEELGKSPVVLQQSFCKAQGMITAVVPVSYTHLGKRSEPLTI